jgi:cellulose synthase/poly-beta-1,6-N-acetylglucosamine synthase-like glycosyltransferase
MTRTGTTEAAGTALRELLGIQRSAGAEDRRRVVVLIPAHNEAAGIAATVRTVLAQTRPADLALVVADNCSDDTEQLAREAGASTFVTVGNTNRKAGALNQALDALDGTLTDDDAVLVMDADTVMQPDFIEASAAKLAGRVGGVGGVFLGRPADTVLGLLQRMEYHRFSREPRRHGDRCAVLTGTGTLFSVRALRDVRDARLVGKRLPEAAGVYDTHSLTEDNELTLALRTLGWDCLSSGVSVVTDVMETVPALSAQRHRWYLGAMRNIVQYGRRLPWHLRWTYWRQQAGLLLASLGSVYYLLLLAVTLALTGHVSLSLPWLLPSLVMLVERTITVWPMGWRARWTAASLIPEQLYTMLLVSIHLGAVLSLARGQKGSWRAT